MDRDAVLGAFDLDELVFPTKLGCRVPGRFKPGQHQVDNETADQTSRHAKLDCNGRSLAGRLVGTADIRAVPAQSGVVSGTNAKCANGDS